MEHRLSAPQIVISTIIEISRNFIIQKYSQIVVCGLKLDVGVSFISSSSDTDLEMKRTNLSDHSLLYTHT